MNATSKQYGKGKVDTFSPYIDSGTADVYGSRKPGTGKTSSAGGIDGLVNEYGKQIFGSAVDKILGWAGEKLDSWMPGWLKAVLEPFAEDRAGSGKSGMFHKYGETGQEVPVSPKYGEMELGLT